MTAPLNFACSCGKLRGHLDASVPKNSTRVVCHCADCRANERYHHCPDPGHNGLDMVQFSPDALHIDAGAEHLKLLQLGPKGIYRWYAGCCGTPLFNSLRSPHLPFVSMRTNVLEQPDVLGKVVTRAFTQEPGQPPRHKGAARMMISLFMRMGAARLSGRWRLNPLFDAETNSPISTPEVISKQDKASLYS